MLAAAIAEALPRLAEQQGGQVELTKLRDEVMLQFDSDDSADLRTQFWAEEAPRVIYELVQEVVARTRGTGRYILAGETAVDPQALKRRARSKWFEWLEHAGTRHIRIGDMTKSDCRLAKQERFRRSDEERNRGRLFEWLENQLLDETTTIREALTEEQIDAAASEFDL